MSNFSSTLFVAVVAVWIEKQLILMTENLIQIAFLKTFKSDLQIFIWSNQHQTPKLFYYILISACLGVCNGDLWVINQAMNKTW